MAARFVECAPRCIPAVAPLHPRRVRRPARVRAPPRVSRSDPPPQAVVIMRWFGYLRGWRRHLAPAPADLVLLSFFFLLSRFLHSFLSVASCSSPLRPQPPTSMSCRQTVFFPFFPHPWPPPSLTLPTRHPPPRARPMGTGARGLGAGPSIMAPGQLTGNRAHVADPLATPLAFTVLPPPPPHPQGEKRGAHSDPLPFFCPPKRVALQCGGTDGPRESSWHPPTGMQRAPGVSVQHPMSHRATRPQLTPAVDRDRPPPPSAPVIVHQTGVAGTVCMHNVNANERLGLRVARPQHPSTPGWEHRRPRCALRNPPHPPPPPSHMSPSPPTPPRSSHCRGDLPAPQTGSPRTQLQAMRIGQRKQEETPAERL